MNFRPPLYEIKLLTEMQYSDPCNSVSCDSLFDGELICYQHNRGYRFSIDSVLVAHFMDVRQNDSILDLGCGSGIISLIVMYRWRSRTREVSGIEVQQGLAELAKKNYQVNNLAHLGKIIQGDITEIDKFIEPESYNKIVCNPPFYNPVSGRINKNPEARIARHQILATLQDFLCAAAFAVKNGGTVFFIYPAERISEFIILAKNNRLEVKKIQFIYSYPGETGVARLVLIQCLKNGGAGSEVLPPLYIYDEKNGNYSSELLAMYKKGNLLKF